MDEVLTDATRWMNLGNTMLSQRNQLPKSTYYMVPCIWNACNRKIYRETKYINGCQGLTGVGEKWGMTANGYRISFGGNEDFQTRLW